MLNLNKSSQRIGNTGQSLFLWVVLVTLLRLLFIALNARELDVDEAQYWAWSQQLDWGYHSKPPLIAWFIAFSTHWLGHAEFAVRFFSPLSYAVSTAAIYLSAKELYDQRSAFWAALSWLLAPAISFSAAIISTDPFMLMFEALSFYALVKALKHQHILAWIGLGLCMGLSFLSKYTALFFMVSMAFYLLWSKPRRKLLLTKGPYLAVLISSLVLLPNLVWNLNHHFVAFNHVSEHNIALTQMGLHPLKLITFWLAQMAMMGPILGVAFVVQLIQLKWPLKPEPDKLLFSFIFPLFLAVSIEALLVRAHSNWGVGIYIAVIIWVSHYLVQTKKIIYLKWSVGIHCVAMLFFYSAEIVMHHNHWLLKDRYNIYRREQGWHQALPSLKTLHQHYKKANYLFSDRTTLFKSLYYLPISPEQAYSWNPSQKPEDQLDLNTSMKTKKAQNFVWITEDPNNVEIREDFRSLRVVKKIDVPISQDKHKTLYWVWLSHYKG